MGTNRKMRVESWHARAHEKLRILMCQGVYPVYFSELPKVRK